MVISESSKKTLKGLVSVGIDEPAYAQIIGALAAIVWEIAREIEIRDFEQLRDATSPALRSVPQPSTPTIPGLWIAFHGDMSGIAVFATEIEATRHAAEHSMRVRSVTLPCDDLRAIVGS